MTLEQERQEKWAENEVRRLLPKIAYAAGDANVTPEQLAAGLVAVAQMPAALAETKASHAAMLKEFARWAATANETMAHMGREIEKLKERVAYLESR